ncbi:outer membrane beta-barrel protein [Pontibacter sp. JH31]|uniref:Outer membrane beta-barrel protein n=1 Tax=Pontibacter aquaedesilientis TaxID=2766980 RepID=A0ABR7XBT3_9BACT|nr:outer membrane beta-barrel protein [Pontibacter aquaedesilientis]MBD1395759.1 outer membrane beta-barrel protein [Pontibacter aquaedesilientis]
MQTLCRAIALTLLLLAVIQVSLKAQDSPRKGYIGVGLGPSFLLGSKEVKTGTGLHLNLLNVGYTIGKGFGITGTWVGGAHALDVEDAGHHHGSSSTSSAHVEVNYGVLMIGPMYTLNLTDVDALDVRLRLGSFYTSEKRTSETLVYTSENRTLGTSIGIGYRRKFANRWSLMLSSDYYAGKQQIYVAGDQSTRILNFTSGVGFML